MNWMTADLADLTDRRAGRAAVVLVVVHLLVGLGAWPLWVFGWLPIFDHARWFPIALAGTYAFVLTLGTVLRFGSWGGAGVPGFGEEYSETFSPGAGFGLGLLRLLMQVVLVLIILPALMMTIFNMRWWNVVGTDELDALPAKAATIPIPDDWDFSHGSRSSTGLGSFMDEDPPDGSEPEGYVKRTYTVPPSHTVEDLRDWMTSDAWTAPGSFGEIEVVHCDSEKESCTAHLVPPAGSEPEYFIDATRYLSGTLILRLDYRAHELPDYDVSDDTVERALLIPVPSDWTLFETDARTREDTEHFERKYTVPDSFTREDLLAWLEGPTWTDPAAGEPFGAIDSPTCVEDEQELTCVGSLAGQDPRTMFHDPIEKFGITFVEKDHSVEVRFTRED